METIISVLLQYYLTLYYPTYLLYQT